MSIRVTTQGERGADLTRQVLNLRPQRTNRRVFVGNAEAVKIGLTHHGSTVTGDAHWLKPG